MTTGGSGWRPGAATEVTPDQRRFGVRCRRCGRTQPPHAAAPHYVCAYCGAPLPMRRWVAHPPPGLARERRVTVLRLPYSGPPGYHGRHPSWGFPPVAWRGATVATGDDSGAPPVRGIGAVMALAIATALACAAAAGAEAWRFALLLAGRTRVLDGGPVHASDVMVAIAGTAALALGVVTAVAAVPTLVSLHRAAALRSGRAPARSGADILARLVVPGWNLYGAGQVLMEILRALGESDSKRRASRITVPLWWLAWVANGLLVVATLIMAFGRSNQIVGDTVEMHIALDVLAGVVAGLFAAALGSLSRSWTGRGTRRYHGWTVRLPESTAENRLAPAGAGGDEPGCVAGDGVGADDAGGDGVGADDAGGDQPGCAAGVGAGVGVGADDAGDPDGADAGRPSADPDIGPR